MGAPHIHHRGTTPTSDHDARIHDLRAQLAELDLRRSRVPRHSSAWDHWTGEIERLDAQLRATEDHGDTEDATTEAGITMLIGLVIASGSAAALWWADWSAWWWFGLAFGAVLTVAGMAAAISAGTDE